MSRLVASLFAAGVALAACRATPPASSDAPAASPASAETLGVATSGAGGPVEVVRSDDPATRRRHAELMRWAAAEGLAARPLGEVAVALGQRLVGVRYVAGVLDAPAEETLLAPLDRFDCVLYVESVLALARGVVAGDTTFGGYLGRVEQQRYRGGRMDGYGSRLHYFSEWIDDNGARNLVRDVTANAQRHEPYTRRLGFMTAHVDRYPHLADAAALADVRAAEARANAVRRTYVPKAVARGAYAAIEPGDVLATTTSVDGLDVSHVGFAVRTAQGIGFLHASPQGGVKLSPDLHAYLAGNRAQTGVFIVRPR